MRVARFFRFADAVSDTALLSTREEPHIEGETNMRRKLSRWTKLVGLGTLATTLLTAGLASAGNIPVASCPNGYRTIRFPSGTAAGICIHSTPGPVTTFQNAAFLCQLAGAHVASAEDLSFVYTSTSLEAFYNPNGKWLGPGVVGDDQALCGNRDITFNGDPDQTNFEGPCNKSSSRQYWCAMDLLP
jgi:hypothetical protein